MGTLLFGFGALDPLLSAKRKHVLLFRGTREVWTRRARD